MNGMIKSWQAENIHLWKVQWLTQTLTASSEVTGTDSEVYTCIRGHTSNINNKPITGGNWNTYWKKTGSTGGTWVTATAYTAISDINLINSVTDSLAFAATPTNTITKTGEMYRFTANRSITVSSAENSNNDGTYKISSVDDNTITTSEDITTTNADDDTAIVKEVRPKIFGIEDAFVRTDDTNDTRLNIITRKDYFEINDKTSEGLPNKIWFEDALIPKIHLWPSPDDSSDVIHFSAVTRLEDFDAGTDEPDFDVKWIEALTFGLAYKLSFEYGMASSERQFLLIESTSLKEMAKNDSNERVDLTIAPDLRRR